MPKAKAKALRLVDILGTISLDEVVRVTISGRTTYSNYVRILETELSSYITYEVKGVTGSNGGIQIFI